MAVDGQHKNAEVENNKILSFWNRLPSKQELFEEPKVTMPSVKTLARRLHYLFLHLMICLVFIQLSFD